MFALRLLLSPFGRMKRLDYWLLSGFLGAANFGLFVLIASRSGMEIKELLTAGPIVLLKSAPLLSVVVLIGLWAQACFILKRSVDFSGGMSFGIAFLALWAAPYFATDLVLGSSDLVAHGKMQLICGIPATLIGMALIFKGSREETEVQSHSRFDTRQEEESDEGTEDHSNEGSDLVARAAVLRAMETPKIETPVQPIVRRDNPSRQSGFGKRRTNSLQAR